MAKKSKGVRILHVEDDVTEAELTQLFLKRMGYDNFDITTAPSAEQGWKYWGMAISTLSFPTIRCRE